MTDPCGIPVNPHGDHGPATATSGGTDHRTTSRPRLAAIAMVLGAAVSPALSCGEQQTTPTTTQPEPVETTAPRSSVVHEFVIPAGTAERLAAGEDVVVIPRTLEVRVGDKIRVHNDDSEFARLGIFDVRPGETVSMAFNTPGPLEGIVFSDESGGCGVPPPDVETFVIDVIA